jgi:hypothetical protein
MTTKKQSVTQEKEKYCGNCYYHSVYSYPNQIFCIFHFIKRKNPIFPTLDVCKNWKQDYQECFCVQKAMQTHQIKQ